MSSNPYASLARAEKVAKILSIVPHGETREQISLVAAWLRRMSRNDRADFAELAGCKPPSDETWEAVCDGAAARTTIAETMDILSARAGEEVQR